MSFLFFVFSSPPPPPPILHASPSPTLWGWTRYTLIRLIAVQWMAGTLGLIPPTYSVDPEFDWQPEVWLGNVPSRRLSSFCSVPCTMQAAFVTGCKIGNAHFILVLKTDLK